jgi:hypothetical protein
VRERTETLPTGIDGTVRCIGRTYDDIGRQIILTSHDAPSAGNVSNEVAWAYDGFGLRPCLPIAAPRQGGNVVAEWQSHAGPVRARTPCVQYVYDDGAVAGEAKHVWLAAVIYPDGRVLEYAQDAGPLSSTVALNRIRSISSAGITNATYHYRGLNRVMGHDTPAVAGGMSKVQAFDRFGRTENLRWQAGGSDVERFQHSHDRLGRRTARLQPLEPSYSETYSYDRFSQLVNMQRGNTDSQAWTLEHAGNWAAWQCRRRGRV